MDRKTWVPWGDQWVNLDRLCENNPDIDRATAGLLVSLIAKISRRQHWDHPGDCQWLELQIDHISYALFPDRRFVPPRARRRRRKQKISRALAKRVFERDAYRCCDCETYLDLTVDHIVPESRGGATTLDNLRTLCRVCNSRKGDRMPDPA